jgi:hypothetical protein
MRLAGLSKIGVLAGVQPNIQAFTRYGRNNAVGAATTPEDVWNGGGVYTGFPISDAETLSIFSSSANDTNGGTGAWQVILTGQGANWELQYETINLNGTTPVTTTKVWRRMSIADVTYAGSLQTNEGTITMRHSTTTANVFAVMPAMAGRTQIACGSSPIGYSFMVTDLFASMARPASAAGSCVISFQTKDNTRPNSAWKSLRTFDLMTTYSLIPPIGEHIEPRHDYRFRVLSASNDCSVSVAISGFYKQ